MAKQWWRIAKFEVSPVLMAVAETALDSAPAISVYVEQEVRAGYPVACDGQFSYRVIINDGSSITETHLHDRGIALARATQACREFLEFTQPDRL